MKLVVTAAARDDLEQIATFIARENPARAVTFLDELEARLQRLTFMPYAYPLVPRYEASGVRRAVHGNYLILYRVRGDAVVIRNVVHGSRDYASLLFPDDASD